MCKLLIVLKKGDSILARDFAMLRDADPILKIIGRIEITCLLVFGRPSISGIVGC